MSQEIQPIWAKEYNKGTGSTSATLEIERVQDLVQWKKFWQTSIFFITNDKKKKRSP